MRDLAQFRSNYTRLKRYPFSLGGTHLEDETLRWKLLVIDLAGLEGRGDGFALAGDHDDPLVTVLLDLHDRRGLQERVDKVGLAEALDVILEVVARHVLVLAHYLHHGERENWLVARTSQDLEIAAEERRTARRDAPAFITTSGGGFR